MSEVIYLYPWDFSRCKDVEAVRLAECELPGRWKWVERYGIETLRDLAQKSRFELLELPNVGRCTVDELEWLLEAAGLRFALALPRVRPAKERLSSREAMERNRAIWNDYCKYGNMEAVGEQYGLTRQRVHQIVKREKERQSLMAARI